MSFGGSGIAAGLAFGRLATHSPPAAHSASARISDGPGLFRYRIMWILAATHYVRLAVVFGMIFWLPTFLRDDFGLSLRIGGHRNRHGFSDHGAIQTSWAAQNSTLAAKL